MDANREKYNQVRVDFIDFVGQILGKVYEFDEGLKQLFPKDCIYRVNKDIRFSKDKKPYKTWLAAFFGNSAKNGSGAGYYFQINHDGTINIGVGQYIPNSVDLLRLRSNLAKEKPAMEFRIVTESKKLLEYFPNSIKNNNTLKVAPKGFPKDHSNIDLLKYKGFAIFNKIDCNNISDVDLQDQIIKHFQVGFPLVQWLRKY